MERGGRGALLSALLLCAGVLAGAPTGARAAAPHVLLVGTYNSIPGQYSTIQAAVNAAQPGDWILIGPGDYREVQDQTNSAQPAGVAITMPGLHLRGMDRNAVIVDGTKPTAATPCSSNPADQYLGPSNQGRNGIEVFGVNKTTNPETLNLADNVSIDNLTVCNFLTGPGGGNGNEIWWNGGDGGGQIGMRGYEGSYLTATSSYSSTTAGSLGPCCGVNNPQGSYGIFSSDATRAVDGTMASWTYDYASNMADSSFYVGACQQRCDVVMDHDHGQYSALCLSTTNAGGYLLFEHSTCDKNKTGPVSNAQNNDDWPSPQLGRCDAAHPTTEPQTGATGTASCTVWQYNTLVDNNNPNVPGNGTSGLAGGGPVGTGLILAGTRDITLYKNDIENNKSWGELIVDLPDQESGPANCHGGQDFNPPAVNSEVCFWPALGNISLDNTFSNNGTGYSTPNTNSTLGDIGLATIAHASPPFDTAQGNCFSGDSNPGGVNNMPTTDPAGIETASTYQPDGSGLCSQSNAGDYGPLTAQAECDSQLLAPCPTLETLCQTTPLPCIPVPTSFDYPRAAAQFPLTMPGAQTTMPDPCAGVPANAWCPSLGTATPDVPYAALPAVVGGVALGGWLLAGRRRRRAIPPA
jgi:hypothetical protein